MCCIEVTLKYFGENASTQEERRGMKMDDEEVRKLVKRTDAEFRALEKRMAKLRKLRWDHIFTEEEKRAWSQAEPDFPKPIIKS